jgi:maltose alpha-D-glucosyltransferase/alpha-amylase
VLQTLSDLGTEGLPNDFVVLRDAVLAKRSEIFSVFRAVMEQPITGKRIRCHGDYHLAQLLRAGSRWVIIDFEGEPIRPLGERRLKRSGLKDVAGMLRSFDYVTTLALERQVEAGIVQVDTAAYVALATHGQTWRDAAGAVFLASYFASSAGAGHLPDTEEQRRMLLRAHLLEKALYELSYELSHRPRLASLPARAIVELLS